MSHKRSGMAAVAVDVVLDVEAGAKAAAEPAITRAAAMVFMVNKVKAEGENDEPDTHPWKYPSSSLRTYLSRDVQFNWVLTARHGYLCS